MEIRIEELEAEIKLLRAANTQALADRDAKIAEAEDVAADLREALALLQHYQENPETTAESSHSVRGE